MFKQICDRASGYTQSNIGGSIDISQKNVWKMSSGRSGFEEDIYNYCIENDVAFSPSMSSALGFTKDFSQSTIYNLKNALNPNEFSNLLKQESKISNNADQPYVLVIDEINRGNISRILGELITLIEDSKRKGSSEALEVMLPYSRKPFIVPNNFYIIGTMNSLDRSLTGLDIALQRRFTFIEIPPKPDIIKNENGDLLEIKGRDRNGHIISITVADLLIVINQRIEVLLDCDHCIGHANFMTLTSNSDVIELSKIFKQKIIPQLQEYFFDDWSKINMILNNNGMLISESVSINQLFLDIDGIDRESIEFLKSQKSWSINKDNIFEDITTYKKIINH